MPDRRTTLLEVLDLLGNRDLSRQDLLTWIRDEIHEAGRHWPVYEVSGFKLDTKTRTISNQTGPVVRLGPTATIILEALMQHPGMVVEQVTLERRIWPRCDPNNSSLRVIVHGLRRRLAVAHAPFRVATISGLGYRLALLDVRDIGAEQKGCSHLTAVSRPAPAVAQDWPA